MSLRDVSQNLGQDREGETAKVLMRRDSCSSISGPFLHSDIDENSLSSHEDGDICAMVVEGCGVPEMNGVYRRFGQCDGVPMYRRATRTKEKMKSSPCSGANSPTIHGEMQNESS